MAQNIYDSPTFFSGYSALPRSQSGLAGMPEWPSLRALLPPLKNATILDLGCGFGWFTRWAVLDASAASVHGVDLSSQMLERARASPSDPRITYQQADLETLDLAGREEKFDVIMSMLALHYVVDLPRLVGQVYAALKPGGSFVFSCEHPIFTAPETPRWVELGEGKRGWVVDGYAKEGRRERDWLGERVVKQHRMTGTYLKILLDAGFMVKAVEDWAPGQEAIKEWEESGKEMREIEGEMERPMFMLVKVEKPKAPGVGS